MRADNRPGSVPGPSTKPPLPAAGCPPGGPSLSDTTDLLTETTARSAQRDTPSADDTPETGTPRTRRRASSGGLSAKVLPELQALAAELGISGTARMRKSQLIEAIQAAQAPAEDRTASTPSSAETERASSVDGDAEVSSEPDRPERIDRGRERFLEREARRQQRAAAAAAAAERGEAPAEAAQGRAHERNDGPERPDREDRNGSEPPDSASPGGDDSEGGRRGRFRERGRNRRGNRGGYSPREPDPVLSDDDVLIPIGGILDLLDNYGFVRTSGYLTGPNDVYVSLQQVRRYGLRRGDAITGQVRQPREGERKDKYNALVRLDSVNGLDVEEAGRRPEFSKLTPLYPQERLRLETDAEVLTTRVIDLVMPVGKGQRALIISPPKAGKTMILQAVANAISVNNPEVHLMVVLVDERPEEVTEMQRAVKGEVIASTFDRPPTDHITVAELSIERAKRLVEMGHDVVLLLDSITRLGRAYNLSAPANGRLLTAGVDAAALYPPKRLLGAARNVEHGGSLTILATALVDTGSAMDSVIFEEFKGTGNAELTLDRGLVDSRVFPAIDVQASGTRQEDALLTVEEQRTVRQLRGVLRTLDTAESLDLVLEKVRRSGSNTELLRRVQQRAEYPGQDEN